MLIACCSAFWRGIGPALVLVINPVLQYTAFEQLKNRLIAKRTAKLRAAGGAVTAVVVLTDLDFFILGALSKLGNYDCGFHILHTDFSFVVATSFTYPYMLVVTSMFNRHILTLAQSCQKSPSSGVPEI